MKKVDTLVYTGRFFREITGTAVERQDMTSAIGVVVKSQLTGYIYIVAEDELELIKA